MTGYRWQTTLKNNYVQDSYFLTFTVFCLSDHKEAFITAQPRVEAYHDAEQFLKVSYDWQIVWYCSSAWKLLL